jgi:hypothetical protein
MNYLKNRGVKDKELYDTSVTFFLQDLGNKTLTKKDFIKEFDEIAPNLKVVALGQPGPKDIINNLYKQIRKIDPKTQDPRVEGFMSYLQSSLPSALHETGNVNQKALDKIAVNVDKYMKDVFGVESAMEKGLALTENVPFAVKEPLVALSSALEKRGVGLKSKDYKRTPAHAGQQTMSGGDNYREFMFRYEPGKLRKTEPVYELPSQHHFGLAEKDRANAFVWARISDRTDEFGRRILFVEEIQSDMHQPIQRALRKAKETGKPVRSSEGYARRGDLPTPQEILVNKQQLDLITLKIENLLNTNPRSKALPKLEKERDKIRTILEEAKAKKGVGGGDVPEGPFQTSQEYMEFVAKYLTRVAKDGKYDGVAFANPTIKNRTLNPGDRTYIGNLSAYGPILNKALTQASKKTGANLLNTVIKDKEGRIYGNVKLLNLKGNTMAEEIISKGVSAYRHGGCSQCLRKPKIKLKKQWRRFHAALEVEPIGEEVQIDSKGVEFDGFEIMDDGSAEEIITN